MIRRHAVVHGEVQGVGFRYNAQAVAEKLGVVGYVRNRSDGTVETEIEGSPEAVQRMLDWLGSGPTWASVTRVEVSEAHPAGDGDFRID